MRLVMNVYRRLLFPLLQRLDPETAHDHALRLLALLQRNSPGLALLRRIAGQLPAQPVDVCGLTFPNVLGVAAGLDKDARVVPALAALGFGHIEVGTLTPRPQPGNPRPRIFRLPEDKALINRMGFPNEGVEAVAPRLRRLALQPHGALVGVSLGKQKVTPLEDAAADYIAVMQRVFPAADYLAVNVSSPNTPGLRELQGARYLESLVRALAEENVRLAQKHDTLPRPLLVKIAPDLSDAELAETLAAITAGGAQGVIATNTTLARPGSLASARRGETGGLSGRPLAAPSTALIARIHRETAGRLPIIGAGGVFTADDVRAKLDAGASLVQIYTGFVYEGPALAGRILRRLAAPRP